MDDLDFDMSPSNMFNCLFTCVTDELSVWAGSKVMLPKMIIFDIYICNWRMTLTLSCNIQNVWFYKIHMYAKYQVSIYDSSKVMANIKVGRKHWQTNKTTDKETGQQTICPKYRLGDIKTVIQWTVALTNKLFTTVKPRKTKLKNVTKSGLYRQATAKCNMLVLQNAHVEAFCMHGCCI